MSQYLWRVPALPLVGFVILALFGGRFSRRVVAWIGVGCVAASAAVAIWVAAGFLGTISSAPSYTQVIWNWVEADGLVGQVALYLDALSMVMVLVVTVVGLLIHIYSAEHMELEEGYSRFFAYMNLFVSSMLVLVLGSDLVTLLLGWEGVGLCSYLLIGFWYREPQNGYAARKAFVVTRIGDTALLIGIFLLFNQLGTLDIQELMNRATQQWAIGSGVAVAAAALILGGAIAKSAQLPLQVWLPDAMAGPTPVSALIHAATMVTAGVYLIARTHALFTLAPAVQQTVAIVAAATLLYAGLSALTQRDIKRVLAYSTISQVGYMFLALGVGAWSAAIFHLMTHAFFKALLFLSAGVVIAALDEEHDIFRMGGLRRRLPWAFWTFLIGAASLSAVPFITAGFYSKELILSLVLSSGLGSFWLWLVGLIGAFITSIYSFRVLFLVFFGPLQKEPEHWPRSLVLIPLAVLSVLAVGSGFLQLPHNWAPFAPFSAIMQTALPAEASPELAAPDATWAQVVTPIVSLLGIYVAYLVYLRRAPGWLRLVSGPVAQGLRRYWLSGWGFDWLYNLFFVRPFVWLAWLLRNDPFDLIFSGIAWLNYAGYRVLSWTQDGRVRLYALVAGIGAAILILIGVLR